MNSIQAVIFDLGGVVLGSPLHAIATYELERGIEPGTINRHVVSSAPTGAWHRLERGEEILGAEFFAAFDDELRDLSVEINSEDMFDRIRGVATPRPEMLEALRRLRQTGFKLAALTNNWASAEEEHRLERTELRACFDVFVESAVVGLRKPDPRIYQLACTELDVEPQRSVFLDDIGINLKGARALGMATIKVDDPRVALRELGELLGQDLVD